MFAFGMALVIISCCPWVTDSSQYVSTCLLYVGLTNIALGWLYD